jgi:hypothetical protein
MSTERADAAKAEVNRLLDAGVISQCSIRSGWPTWSWSERKTESGDFTDLNKCCSKDPYLLPKIDKLVDIATGCEMISLLDCFLGYLQIWINPEDKEKMSFITPGGTYCYWQMLEGLRNVGLTFSRMIDEVFDEQTGKNLVAYIDDLVAKSDKKDTHIQDL